MYVVVSTLLVLHASIPELLLLSAATIHPGAKHGNGLEANVFLIVQPDACRPQYTMVTCYATCNSHWKMKKSHRYDRLRLQRLVPERVSKSKRSFSFRRNFLLDILFTYARNVLAVSWPRTQSITPAIRMIFQSQGPEQVASAGCAWKGTHHGRCHADLGPQTLCLEICSRPPATFR